MSILAGDLRTLSYEATLYLYPLVLMDVTRLQAVSQPPGVNPIAGPHNEFRHVRAFPPADFRAVVRPNFDTLYSSAWLDLTRGPVIVHAPDTDDRFFMLPMLDMWTDVFANPGKRTTGTAAQDFLVVWEGWSGEVPSAETVISAPTPYVWIIGRTQTNGPADYANVHKVQDGYRITVLGEQPAHATADSGIDVNTEPLRLVNAMAPVDFFTYAARLLSVNPPHASDFSILARISRLGIVAGQPFAGDFDAAQLAEIQAGRDAALRAVSGGLGALGIDVDGWMTVTDGIGVYGNSYFRRAAVACGGLG